MLLVEAAPPAYVQGIVCSLKESFGFIERADKVNEVCSILLPVLNDRITKLVTLLYLNIPFFFYRYFFTIVSFREILMICYLVMMCSLLYTTAMYVT